MVSLKQLEKGCHQARSSAEEEGGNWSTHSVHHLLSLTHKAWRTAEVTERGKFSDRRQCRSPSLPTARSCSGPRCATRHRTGDTLRAHARTHTTHTHTRVTRLSQLRCPRSFFPKPGPFFVFFSRRNCLCPLEPENCTQQRCSVYRCKQACQSRNASRREERSYIACAVGRRIMNS